jgi:type II secretory pathway component PulF
MKPKLIPQWRKIYKYISVQIPALNVAFLATWALLPEKFQDALPISYVIVIAITLLVAGVVGRMIAQPGLKEKDETK